MYFFRQLIKQKRKRDSRNEFPSNYVEDLKKVYCLPRPRGCDKILHKMNRRKKIKLVCAKHCPRQFAKSLSHL